MRKVTTTENEIVQFRQDVQTKLRQRVREAIETVLDEELAAALGCEAYQRCKGRRGYRNGSEQRPLTTEIGTREIRVPRGRLQQNDGTTAEFRSELLPRYARRTKVIDEAILGIYLAGANSRRIRKALEPLLGDGPLVQECRLPRRRASEEVIRELERTGPVRGTLRDTVRGWVPPQGPPGSPCRLSAGLGRARGRRGRHEGVGLAEAGRE